MTDEKVTEIKIENVKKENFIISFINRHTTAKRFFLYLFYLLEGLGSMGLIYGAFKFFYISLMNISLNGYDILLFSIGLCVAVWDVSIRMLNAVGIELRKLDLEGKQ